MGENKNSTLSLTIKEKALSLGFDLCGIAPVKRLTENEAVLLNWCESGMHDKMNYLSRGTETRANPALLFPGAKSLIVTGLNYFTGKLQKHDDVPVVSRYAFGKDYHDLITEKLDDLLSYIKTLSPGTDGKAFVDSAPLLEKPWAVQAGLGWQGKHSIVINDDIGSFFFIGVLVLTIELDYDAPCSEDKCGPCRVCIENCPTGAINNDRTIDARKCIANLTIENRGPVPEEMIPLIGGRIYGCDRCQEVCPWNRHARPHNHPELIISDDLADMTREDWRSMTNEQFIELFRGTPVARVRFDRFKNNIEAVLKDRNQI